MTPATLKGSWEIHVVGNIATHRIRDGTFDFRPQNDGSVLVNATFRMDNLNVTLTGTASLNGELVPFVFDATTAAGGSWSDRGQFESAGRGVLTGRLALKDGTFAALELRKVS